MTDVDRAYEIVVTHIEGRIEGLECAVASLKARRDEMVTTSKSRGPQPDRLKIDVSYEEGLKRALSKPKPKDGWPKVDVAAERAASLERQRGESR